MKAIIDLHCHTVASGHAYSTVKENVEEAKAKGLKFLGISDHGPNMPGGAHPFHFYNLRVLKKEINGVRILKGVEANIIDFNGSLDVDADLLEQLDYAIASLHPPCIDSGTIEECTNALIKAMENPSVKVIGHPDDSRFPIDYEKLVKAAKLNGVLLEINNSSLKADGYREGASENVRTILNLCKKYEVKIILGSDSHIYYEIGEFGNCIRVLEDVDFPGNLVVNYNEEDIKLLGF